MSDDPKPSGLPIGPMLLHAALAAVFFYWLQRYGLGQTAEASALWAVIAAPFAAYLAYTQSRR